MAKSGGGTSKDGQCGKAGKAGGRGPSTHSGPGGNWPSTTGKPSGGGRGVAPPKGK